MVCTMREGGLWHLFKMCDSSAPALQLTGDHLLLHHHNGFSYHIYQLDNTHARPSLIPSHTILCSPSASLSTPHFSCYVSLHLIALWKGELVNDSSNSSPLLVTHHLSF